MMFFKSVVTRLFNRPTRSCAFLAPGFAPGVPSVGVADDSAFIRMRSACAKSSCVMMPSVRTSVRVCRCVRGQRRRAVQERNNLTYCQEDVALPYDHGEGRSEEEPRDPNPRTDDSAFSARLQVTK